jgi:8-hydroxy-5-deazaflavin:NADPH oxidoreductase
VRVAVVGGTGAFGRALATRLSAAGDAVVIGSRDADRAQTAAEQLGVEGGPNQEAVRGVDLVVLAVAAGAAVQTANSLARAIGATPLLSVASELRFGKGTVRPGSEGASVAEQVAEVVPGPVAAGLHSLAASTLGGTRPPDEDALVCGDDSHAKELSLDLASRIVAGRALDAGPLANARALEGLTAVIVTLNRRYKGHAGIRITGLA